MTKNQISVSHSNRGSVQIVKAEFNLLITVIFEKVENISLTPKYPI